MMNYVPSAVPTILGIVGAMSKNPSLRVMGYSAAATGALKLLKVAGVDIPGMAGVRGVGAPRLGYPNRLGAMPSPMEMEMDMVHG